MTRTAYVLSSQEQRELMDWALESNGRLSSRARAILLSSQGLTALRVAEKLGMTVRTVYKWRQRFAASRVAGLRDRARPGQPRRLPREQRDEIVRRTVDELPPQGQRWTIRLLAKECGITQHQVRKIWAEHGLRPHAGKSTLVPDASGNASALRLLGLFVCPFFAVLAVQMDSVGVSAQLGRRVPRREVVALRCLLREAATLRAKGDPAESVRAFAMFVERVADRAERTRVHLVFSACHLLADEELKALVSARPNLTVSSKACLSTWADVVELWLEQATLAPREAAAVTHLAQAAAEHLARSQARSLAGRLGERALGLSRLGEPRIAFSWWRRDALAPAPSVGLLPAKGADL